jgi:hypothetical protein
MQFRWVALIAIWTLIAGPIFYMPRHPARRPDTQAASTAVKIAAPAP